MQLTLEHDVSTGVVHYHPPRADEDRPSYPESQRVGADECRDWPENVRAIRTCQYCRHVFRHAGAAVACERHHKRGGNTDPGAPP